MPYDVPIAGYRNDTVNTLRLWRARASQELDLADFNAGDYLSAVEDKDLSETISKVLYPNDLTVMGKELRLQQQYFFVSCAIHDIINRYLKIHDGFEDFPDKVAIQLNDTHPAVAVAELMRVLVDEQGLEWDEAWEIGRATFGYTNHTLMPEALERWSVDLFGRVLPRHLEIIYEINRRFLETLRTGRKPDEGAVSRMCIIEEGTPKQVRMANLAVVGSHSVNGVAELHTDLLRRELFRDFDELWPERFNNKTNGVTPRRWLLQANPALAGLLNEAIGPGWVTDAAQLRKLEPFADDAAFRERFRKVKRDNKARLAEIVRAENGISLDLDSIFDVQVKRIHEYKRQLLNVLRVASRVPADEGGPELRSVPAQLPARRQGGAGLRPGQVDHQAHQRRGRGGQPRRGRARPAHRGLPQELPGVAGRADLPGLRGLGADLDRRQGGLRDRQHEVRPERRAHHRHARRRQRRDPRGGRRRRTSSSSA